MKKTMNLIGIIIVSIAFLISCKDNSTNINDTNNLIPLKIGNKWIYSKVWFDSTGKQKFNPLKDSLEIVGDTLINNSKFYLQRQGFNNAIYPIIMKNDGIYIYDINFKQICMTCKYPGSNGDHFSSCIGETIIESNNHKLSIPLGSFECYKYVINDKINSYRIYYSPNIGLVQEEWYNVDSKGNVYLSQSNTLFSYILK